MCCISTYFIIIWVIYSWGIKSVLEVSRKWNICMNNTILWRITDGNRLGTMEYTWKPVCCFISLEASWRRIILHCTIFLLKLFSYPLFST